ncbi:hypothetical protein [Tsukamurella tyrosinosolvens]|uniref:hypothetical protein n=1 Tax=Tsukamurella tyrosinosolvens TaxID=57704 RepID=UPI001E58591C|nr:hypothetical protein [Tsukamurella tyrosinosolvens]
MANLDLRHPDVRPPKLRPGAVYSPCQLILRCASRFAPSSNLSANLSPECPAHATDYMQNVTLLTSRDSAAYGQQYY